MIRTGTTKFLFVIIILFSGEISGQNISDLSFAEMLYKTGDYYNAITEYKRVLFFNSENSSQESRGHIYFKIGLCYKNGGFTDNSLYYITKAIENETDKYLRNFYQLNITRVWMQKEEYATAEMELKDLLDKNISKVFRDSVYYYLGWNSLFEYKWTKAGNYFSKIDKTGSKLTELTNSCANAKALRLKSPDKAILLSTLIPGAGQIYCEEIFNGTISFLLNSAIIYFLIDSVKEKRYTDTAMIYFLLFSRYYPANRTNAYKYALRYNLNLKKSFLNDLIKKFGFNF